MRLWAREAASKTGVDFKARRGWMLRFMERNELSIRRKTTGQSLPKNLVPQIVEIDIFCKKQRHLQKFPLSAIANMAYGDNSYQATTHIRRQLISIWKSENSYQAITHINQNSCQKIYS